MLASGRLQLRAIRASELGFFAKVAEQLTGHS